MKFVTTSNIIQPKDIKDDNVRLLINDGVPVGTGSYIINHITRVYVLPIYQQKGYGSFIMNKLEEEISKEYTTIKLEASLPASIMYERRGYKTVKHEQWECENGVILVYEIMEKETGK